MAGHSKWKNIQHRKGAQDIKRSKIFSKISREIAVAVRLGGEDADSNARLRLVLNKARAANMPGDNINRAIKKAAGGQDGNNYSEKIYEAFAAAGSAFLVHCLTDNANRTVSEVRHAFTRHGGNLGNDGSVAWMFDRIGLLVYPRQAITDFEQFVDRAVENGADDVEENDTTLEVSCAPQNFAKLKQALDSFSVAPQVEVLTYVAKDLVTVSTTQMETLSKLIDHLDDLDDVQDVYHNIKLGDV